MTRTIVRRTAAVLTSAGVAAALALFPPVTAGAAVHGSFQLQGVAEADYTGPTMDGSCELSDGDANVLSSPATFSNGTKHRSVSTDATFTSSDTLSDTVRVRGHLDSSLTLVRQHHDLTSLLLRAGGTLGVQHSIAGSTCRGSGELLAQIGVTFTEHKKGWLYLTRDTRKPHSIIQTFVVDLNTNRVVTLDIYSGDHSHLTSRAKLQPGRYGIEGFVGLAVGTGGVELAKGSLAQKAKFTTTVTARFKPLKH